MNRGIRRFKVSKAQHVKPVEIELCKNFKDLVIASKNPGINKAKRKGVSYTITKGSDIVEVKGHRCSVVGKVVKSDVILSKGRVYRLTK